MNDPTDGVNLGPVYEPDGPFKAQFDDMSYRYTPAGRVNLGLVYDASPSTQPQYDDPRREPLAFYAADGTRISQMYDSSGCLEPQVDGAYDSQPCNPSVPQTNLDGAAPIRWHKSLTDAYLAILEEGQVDGCRDAILIVGAERLGPAAEWIRSQLYSITDRARLQRMIRRAMNAMSWQQILETF